MGSASSAEVGLDNASTQRRPNRLFRPTRNNRRRLVAGLDRPPDNRQPDLHDFSEAWIAGRESDQRAFPIKLNPFVAGGVFPVVWHVHVIFKLRKRWVVRQASSTKISPGKFPVFKDTDGEEFRRGFPSCAENYTQNRARNRFRLNYEVASPRDRLRWHHRHGRCCGRTDPPGVGSAPLGKRPRVSGHRTGTLGIFRQIFCRSLTWWSRKTERSSTNPAAAKPGLIAAPPSETFVAELARRGVNPLGVGTSIVATREPHETTVVEVIEELGLELQVIFNKGAVMVLPSGINKATGLAAALQSFDIPRKMSSASAMRKTITLSSNCAGFRLPWPTPFPLSRRGRLW